MINILQNTATNLFPGHRRLIIADCYIGGFAILCGVEKGSIYSGHWTIFRV